MQAEGDFPSATMQPPCAGCGKPGFPPATCCNGCGKFANSIIRHEAVENIADLAGGIPGRRLCRWRACPGPWLVVGLHNPFWAIWPYAGDAGVIVAVVLFLVFALLRRLPGLRKSGLSVMKPIKFGPAQAVWLLAGFVAMQLAGLLGFLLLLNIVRVLLVAVTHRPPLFDATGPGADIAATLAGTLAAAWWCVWYIVRRGAVRLRDGGPAGIAWRPAQWRGYGAAVVIALLVILIVMALFHFLPPDTAEAGEAAGCGAL